MPEKKGGEKAGGINFSFWKILLFF